MLKGTGFAYCDDDWVCHTCGRWHRRKTLMCRCGAPPPKIRTNRSTYRKKIKEYELGLGYLKIPRDPIPLKKLKEFDSESELTGGWDGDVCDLCHFEKRSCRKCRSMHCDCGCLV